jgi:hypothetical protein
MVIFLCVFTEQLQKVIIKIVRYVHPSLCKEQGNSHQIDFHGIFNELKLDKITDTLHEDLHTFMISCQWCIVIRRWF